MPSRRRHKSQSNSSFPSRPAGPMAGPGAPNVGAPTDVERFAAALKDAEKAGRAEKARQQQERTDAALLAEQAAAQATALSAARRELGRAVEAVRNAKQVGHGRAEADQAWKVAKALIIELETGTPPAWAPKLPAPAVADDSVEPTEEGDELSVVLSARVGDGAPAGPRRVLSGEDVTK